MQQLDKNEKERSVLDDLLANRSPEFREKVLRTVVRLNLGVNDPAFLFAVALGQLEILLEDSPRSMERLFKVWTHELGSTLEQAEVVIVQRQKEAITKAATELIKRSDRVQGRQLWSAIVPAGLVVSASLLVGVIAGIGIPIWWGGGLAPGEPRQLTMDEAKALEWAQSSQGKLAQNIMEWNASYLEGLNCQKDVQSLVEQGVTLSVDGREATSGFCVLWVEPLRSRSFQ